MLGERLVGFIVVFFLFTCWTTEAGAQAPAGPSRQVHVTTDPPGVRAATSHGRVAVNTPFTFAMPATVHSSIILDGAGYERATVPIPAGAQDLHLNVDMSRPVFEWGIALSVIGGLMVIVGVALVAEVYASANDALDGLGISASVNDFISAGCRAGDPACHRRSAGFAMLGVGTGILTGGILMMALDRQHDPTWSWGE